MSPKLQNRLVELLGFPRVSGDEPGVMNAFGRESVFSPRERG